jgi:hypothetical protein
MKNIIISILTIFLQSCTLFPTTSKPNIERADVVNLSNIPTSFILISTVFVFFICLLFWLLPSPKFIKRMFKKNEHD